VIKYTAAAFLFAFVVSTSLALAQNKVDQGAPGKQGAWPVTTTNASFPSDGGLPTGTSALATYPYPCSAVYQAVYFMDAGIQTIGVAPGARLYTIACNSRDNSTGTIRCRADADAGVLVTTAGSIGDALSPGDCISYTNPRGKPIRCIGATTYLMSFECAP
jgi:hypothetical protein